MPNTSPHRWRRRLLWTAGSLIAVVLGIVLLFSVSPWPGALAVRWVFERDAARVTDALEKHAPDGVDLIENQQYRDGDQDAFLDVYYPASTVAGASESGTAALPTVIWTHGGAWVSGSKTSYAPYYQLLASRGFTVVSLNYSLGPNHNYPTAVHQLNDAHAYILENAERLHVDPNKIFLAGDSAGAQLSSQLATAVTNLAYADQVGITPALSPEQLRGVVLNCGIYDIPNMVGSGGIVGWGVDTALWAYTGVKRFVDSQAAEQMSSLHFVTADFPATFVTGGNADPLTKTQSKPLADKLSGLGVSVDSLFYPADHEPALAHEYQFDLDNEDGLAAFERTIAFLETESK